MGDVPAEDRLSGQMARLVRPQDRAGQLFRATSTRRRKYDYDYQISKVGKPTDRLEWGMTPQTVNAYYNPTDNTINFPAAILQPPFFDAKADDAINYGGIGAVIGHEATHGYDDQGSQFDAKGNNVELVDEGRPRKVRRAHRSSWSSSSTPTSRCPASTSTAS